MPQGSERDPTPFAGAFNEEAARKRCFEQENRIRVLKQQVEYLEKREARSVEKGEARAAERVRREEVEPLRMDLAQCKGLLEALHPEHPQPELCPACKMLERS